MPLPAYPRSTFVASKDPERIYSYLDVPASSFSTAAPPILFLHGFPNLAIGWSEQIDYFSSRGHRCIAPDMLGYGLTSRPERQKGRLGEYAIMSMSADIAGLVRHALSSDSSSSSSSSAGKVIVISHDHGANFAWKFTHYHPDLVLGMVGLCVPYARITSRWASREVITQIIPTFGYQMLFEEERSTRIIQDQLETFLLNIYSRVGLFTLDPSQERTEAESPEFRGNLERLLLQAAGKHSSSSSSGASGDALGSSQSEKEEKRNDLIMDPEVFDYYMEQFGVKAGGIDGALNWYRTRKMNFDDEQTVKDKSYPSSFPVLAVVPDRDAALPSALFSNLLRDIPHAERVDMHDCGHFVQLEQPQQLAKAIEEWMVRHGLTGAKKAHL